MPNDNYDDFSEVIERLIDTMQGSATSISAEELVDRAVDSMDDRIEIEEITIEEEILSQIRNNARRSGRRRTMDYYDFNINIRPKTEKKEKFIKEY